MVLNSLLGSAQRDDLEIHPGRCRQRRFVLWLRNSPVYKRGTRRYPVGYRKAPRWLRCAGHRESCRSGHRVRASVWMSSYLGVETQKGDRWVIW